VAAFCGCCGAEITLKAEACPLCGTPQHGMSPQPALLPTLDIEADYREASEALEAGTSDGARSISARVTRS